MTPYHLYAADFDSPEPSPYLSPFVFDTQERAVEAAFKLLAHSKIVWRITGPEGFKLGRQQIEQMHWEEDAPDLATRECAEHRGHAAQTAPGPKHDAAAKALPAPDAEVVTRPARDTAGV